MDREVSIGLQIFHRLLPRLEPLKVLAQRCDFLDLFVEFLVLALDEFIAIVLYTDVRIDHESYGDDGNDRGAERQRNQHVEVATPLRALLRAVREQVDANHQPDLRMASPVAITSEGESRRACLSRMPGPSSIPLNGLRIEVTACVRVPTTSTNPGMTAQPPASRM